MGRGDAQRAWFPEMLAELRKQWHPQMSWDECTQFCQKMTALRKSIWKERNIKPARMWCPNCRDYHCFRPADISVRSMLFALRKISVIDDDEFKKLDRAWKKYRKEQS